MQLLDKDSILIINKKLKIYKTKTRRYNLLLNINSNQTKFKSIEYKIEDRKWLEKLGFVCEINFGTLYILEFKGK